MVPAVRCREFFHRPPSPTPVVSYGSLDTIGRQEGHPVQDMRCLELIADESQDQAQPDAVRWAVQIALLVLVSPALLAVFAVGGTCIALQKAAKIADRAFAADRPALHSVVRHGEPIQERGTPA